MATKSGGRTRPRAGKSEGAAKDRERAAAAKQSGVKIVGPADAELIPRNSAAAKKDGVRLVASSKVPGTYFVMVAGTRERAISGRLASESAAHAAIKRAGLRLAS